MSASAALPATTQPAATPATQRPERDRALKLAALVVCGLAAAAGIVATRDDGLGRSLAVGLGAAGVAALAGFVVARITTARSGSIATIVVGMLAIAVVGVGALGVLTSGEGDGNEFTLGNDESSCLGRRGFGSDDLDVLVNDVSVAGAVLRPQLFDAISSCAPRALQTETSIESFRSSLSQSFDGDVTTAEASCVIGGLISAPVASELLNGTDAEGYDLLLADCLSESTFAQLEPDPLPSAVGDDPSLDDLVERCRAGSDIACDVLFESSSDGTEYARIAESCGGRLANSDFFCVAGMVDLDENTYVDAESPGWAAVIADCEGGDMASCDFAWFKAELGSDQELLGQTCGGRRTASTGRTCTETYGDTATE